MKQIVLYIISGFCFFLWWGGFTFYASFVVPTGMDVLGSHVLMGFITQQVSVKLNIACAIAIGFALFYLMFYKGDISPKARRFMFANLAFMGILLLGLFILHTYMDALLNFGTRTIINEPHFYLLHRIYLLTSTAMWIQGILHIIYFLRHSPLSLIKRDKE